MWDANGYVEGNNQVNKIAKAAACMKGEAADWYERKRRTINRWDALNGVGDFTHELKEKYANQARKNQWAVELQTIKQKLNEKVGEYAGRYRKLLNKVAPGVNDLAPLFKVNILYKD